ncbi:MAG: type II toxin-antitoxin system HicB family antitoxin [Chloroflexi bacterium]|nr:MAG: type II toxin-antitoxin system HicB family antitoxin [Chloroflexota bacterium]
MRKQRDYHINIFWSEEDACYVADIPDLRCSAFGETPLEALAELQIAKELWLETAREHKKRIPPPRCRPASTTSLSRAYVAA